MPQPNLFYGFNSGIFPLFCSFKMYSLIKGIRGGIVLEKKHIPIFHFLGDLLCSPSLRHLFKRSQSFLLPLQIF